MHGSIQILKNFTSQSVFFFAHSKTFENLSWAYSMALIDKIYLSFYQNLQSLTHFILTDLDFYSYVTHNSMLQVIYLTGNSLNDRLLILTCISSLKLWYYIPGAEKHRCQKSEAANNVPANLIYLKKSITLNSKFLHVYIQIGPCINNTGFLWASWISNFGAQGDHLKINTLND